MRAEELAKQVKIIAILRPETMVIF